MGSLQLPMQILQGRSARSDLHEVLPTNDLHVGQSVMYQCSVTK